jgi:probable H4MPT-linked C1 transfer pathway protein
VRWPGAIEQARHGLTMTAEMVDLFPDRASGVAALAAQLALELTGTATPTIEHLAWYAGPTDESPAADASTETWLASADAAAHWRRLASANYLATASLAAAVLCEGVLVDIGSTTTDLIAFRGGSVLTLGQGDAGRLASGELVYQGVVRTPLIALAQRVPFAGQNVSVMNELFATSADVYRLTGELDDAHDQQPTADGAAKTLGATRQRLARLLGRDAADASAEQWLALARFWRERQLAELAQGLQRVAHASRLPEHALLLAAGCGAFLVAELARDLGRPALSFGADVLGLAPGHALTGWAQVCAPAVAVALLLET